MNKFYCKIFNLENKKDREEYCDLRTKEDSGKGIHIRKCEILKKKFKYSNADTGEVNEHEEINYIVEWTEESTPDKKKKKSIF